MMSSDLDPRIAELLADAERKWGRGALVRLGDAVERPQMEVIPTGFPSLDAALGIGGLPCGRISEIFGPDSSGKHALAANLVVQCQRSEGVAVYVDLGRRLDPEALRAMGVDFHSLLVARPKGRLQALEMAIRLARSGGVKLMIVDLQLPWGGGTGTRGCAGTRREQLRVGYPVLSPLSLALRRLVSAVDRNGIAFVFLTDSTTSKPSAQNLARCSCSVDKQAGADTRVCPSRSRRAPSGAGDEGAHACAHLQMAATIHQDRRDRALVLCPTSSGEEGASLTPPALGTTPTQGCQNQIGRALAPTARPSGLSPQPSNGGQALRFFASVRLGLERLEWIRRGRDVMGCRSRVQVAKNKLAPPLQETEIELVFYRLHPAAPVLQLFPSGRQDVAVREPDRVRYA
ncbi:MAG: hypothetical protein ACM3US_01735 [Sphingomonadaceae bacterium]